MNIKEISIEIHENNKAKGFWDEKRNVGEMLMLVVSELSEALEADRKGRRLEKYSYVSDMNTVKAEIESSTELFKMHVKDTFEDEIADAVIRLFDIAEGLHIDLEWHIRHKLNYNKTRQDRTSTVKRINSTPAPNR